MFRYLALAPVIGAAFIAALSGALPAQAAEPIRPVAAGPAATVETRAQVLARRLRDPNGPVMIIAHRGCHVEAPENSIAAFKRCMYIGIDVVETDVQHTKDGVMVLMHDLTVDRTTNGTGKVSDFALAELKQLRLRYGKAGPVRR